MPVLPFEISKADQAFLAGLEVLRVRGSPLTEEQAFEVFGVIARYLIGITDEIAHWWDKVEAHETDMRHRATTLPAVIHAKCRLSARNMSPQLAELRSDLLAEDRPTEVMDAQNVYIAILVEDIKSDPVLRLAS